MCILILNVRMGKYNIQIRNSSELKQFGVLSFQTEKL